MPLSERVYLEHIRAACLDVARDGQDLSMEQLASSDPRRNSVMFSLIVIGEAVNQLSSALTSRHPLIPWRRVVDLRNLVAHRYFALDPHLLWETIHEHVPVLLTEVEIMLAEMTEGEVPDGPAA